MTPNQAEELHECIRISGLPPEERKRLHAIVAADIDTPARKGHAYIKVWSNGVPCDTRIEAVDSAGRSVPIEVNRIEYVLDMRTAALKLRRDRLQADGGYGDEVEFILPTNDIVVRRIGEVLKPTTSNVADIDAEPEVTPPVPEADWRKASGIPRASCIDLQSDAEGSIRTAIAAVEKVGAHERLTQSVISLGQALDHLAAYVDTVVLKGEFRKPDPSDFDTSDVEPEPLEPAPAPYKPTPQPVGPHAHDFVDGVCKGCLKRQ